MSEDKRLRPRDPSILYHRFHDEPHVYRGSNQSDFHVLIVEDAASTQMLLRVLLAEHCNMTIIPTAPTALAVARTSRTKTTDGEPVALSPPFDMIIVDIDLDGSLPGLALLSRLRAQEALRETPIVALTAHALSEDRKRFLANELDAYRGKPFTPNELFSLVMQIID